jgi:sulfonate transport system substrate-binding protein
VSLVRNVRAVATALTVLEAGEHVAHTPADAAAVFSSYGGKGSIDDLTTMLKSHTHRDHPIGDALKKQVCPLCR